MLFFMLFACSTMHTWRCAFPALPLSTHEQLSDPFSAEATDFIVKHWSNEAVRAADIQLARLGFASQEDSGLMLFEVIDLVGDNYTYGALVPYNGLDNEEAALIIVQHCAQESCIEVQSLIVDIKGIKQEECMNETGPSFWLCMLPWYQNEYQWLAGL